MKRLIVALMVGLAMGYHYGYDDGNLGRDSVVKRALDRFGTSKLKRAQAEHDRRVDEASKP